MSDPISIADAVILGVVEGITEFLPVSSTGHLTIVEDLLGLQIENRGVTAFTAIIQSGAILASIIYFWRDIWRLATAWVRGLTHAEERGSFDFRFAWFVIWGSVPIGVVGFLGKDIIAGPLRSLWWVAAGLILWSAVMWWAEKVGRQDREEKQTTLRDALFIGVMQCFALVPGVSRSGTTISAGLFRNLDRVTATRLSFFLAIPALVGAGAYELKDAFGTGVSGLVLLVGTAVSFVVAYATIAWLLRFVAHHPITKFIPYRLGLGALLIVALATGLLSAT